MVLRGLTICLAIAIAGVVHGFAPALGITKRSTPSTFVGSSGRSFLDPNRLKSSPSPDNKSNDSEPSSSPPQERKSAPVATQTKAPTPQAPPAPSSSLSKAADYPLNLPSPILLATSMILAIAATGSLFEIIEGKSSPLNIGISILGIPITIFLFYAAIKKGEAETREDDERYLRGRR